MAGRIGFVNFDLLRKFAAMEQEEAWGIPIIVDEDANADDTESDTDEASLVDEGENEVNGEVQNYNDDEVELVEEEFVDDVADDEEVADYIDEGVIEDCSDDASDIVMKSLEIPNGDVLHENVLYCFTYSMVLVRTDLNEEHQLCYMWYIELVRLSGVEEYEHRHYDCHTTSTYAEYSFHCSSCRQPLQQVRLTRTCVICNYVKPQTDNDSASD